MTAPGADAGLAGHQLLIRSDGSKLGVTCPCLLTLDQGPYQPYAIGGVITERRQSAWRRAFIETRSRFPVSEARAVWLAWHEGEGSGS